MLIVYTIFKKRRFPQQAPLHTFSEPGYSICFKGSWFVANLFLAWRLTIFFKWILKLKFFLKQVKHKFSKLQVGPMSLRCKFMKTKNARMGKGRGGSKIFLVTFLPNSKLFCFKNKSPLFFYRFYSFIRKSQARNLFYFLGNITRL